MQIDERVRDAHLTHFCPGGAGFPVTSSGSVGLGPPATAPAGLDDHAARAAGQRCGRCGQPIAPGLDVRRHVTGIWVHETCPGLTGAAR
jgi:hypothetical protein